MACGWMAALRAIQTRFHFHLASLSLDFSGGTKKIGFLTKQTYQSSLSNAPITPKLMFDLRITISRHSRKVTQHISVPHESKQTNSSNTMHLKAEGPLASRVLSQSRDSICLSMGKNCMYLRFDYFCFGRSVLSSCDH